MKVSDPLSREKAVVASIISLGCKHFHRTHRELCPDCRNLLEYSHRRLDFCTQGPQKPSCASCSVHCFKPEMRRKIRDFMKWAGPRMILLHPVITLKHLGDLMRRRLAAGRRPRTC